MLELSQDDPKCFSRLLGTSQVILDSSAKEWTLAIILSNPEFDDNLFVTSQLHCQGTMQGNFLLGELESG